jgi:hypothetical protein
MEINKNKTEKQIKNYLNKKSGFVSVKFISLKDGTEISVNENNLLHSMSTFKSILAAFFCMNTGEDLWKEAEKDIKLMLINSDNEATTRIFKRLESFFNNKNVLKFFNEFLKENGMKRTFVQGWNFPFEGYMPLSYGFRRRCIAGELCNKATTANGLADFYKKLYEGNLFWKNCKISLKQKSKILAMLKKNSSYQKGFTNTNSFVVDGKEIFYTKTGASSHSPIVYNDAGVIKTKLGDYILAILVMNSFSFKEAQEILQNIAKIISKNLKK